MERDEAQDEVWQQVKRGRGRERAEWVSGKDVSRLEGQTEREGEKIRGD